MPPTATPDELRQRAANVAPEDLIKCAESLGWEYRGVGGGGHHKLSKEGRRPLTVPNHATLKKGTVLAILKELQEEPESDHE